MDALVFTSISCLSKSGNASEVHPEMEKRADTADISVLFLFGCADILAVYVRRACCNLLIMTHGLY